MTFVIAQITDDDGALSLMADTKVTVAHDERATRQIYTRPCQKIVILDDNLVAGFAGDTPDTALRHLVGLRGKTIDEVIENLVDHTARLSAIRGVSKSFVIAKRAPAPQLWTVSNGDAEDRTAIRTAWVGDRDAHRAYTGFSLQLPQEMSRQDRFVRSVMTVILFDDIPTVGGYSVRVTGSASQPFRFKGDIGSTGPWFTEALVTQSNGTISLQFVLPPGADPTENTRIPIPGEGTTFSALAHYVPECDTAWLHTHEDPSSEPIVLRVHTINELLHIAATKYQQYLQMPTHDSTRALLGLLPTT
ncbi:MULTISPECIES: hypothetical protein [unclassified Rhodococcus (in: high G+C Gram-positive bacteria)]|uniref:hypothetical protein n=1 Tax=unclassified Rhodococcus (in: high G+C Gram-positive bacteria) TaxID=192944 RepID=UPI0011C0EF92|nr:MULTISPECIES: hypothetical protein [unclassified Rhodococcus (in: high G+C Gram-positive bacteria)]